MFLCVFWSRIGVSWRFLVQAMRILVFSGRGYPSVLISYITFTRIQVDLCVLGTHLRAQKIYVNSQYTCAEISDIDPIGDQSHNEGNPQFWSHPNPLIPPFPHLGAGGKQFS